MPKQTDSVNIEFQEAEEYAAACHSILTRAQYQVDNVFETCEQEPTAIDQINLRVRKQVRDEMQLKYDAAEKAAKQVRAKYQ